MAEAGEPKEGEPEGNRLLPDAMDPGVVQRPRLQEDGREEKSVATSLESIIYGNGELKILNQLMIPLQQVYESIETVEESWAAIRLMKVRGAPAIAMVGALSIAVELGHEDRKFEAAQDLREFVERKFDYLKTARATAVNLDRAKMEVLSYFDEQAKAVHNVEALKLSVIGHIGDMLTKDRQDNKSIGRHGGAAILEQLDGSDEEVRADSQGDSGGASVVKRKVSVLTHCNTGSLATAGYGTALGVIRRLHELGRLKMAYCTETRPYNQGARLTAYELVVEGIPGTLIADSMAAAAMQNKAIDAVVVGADRVVKNGDVANKIGTLQLAVVADYFRVPFYVAAPTTSFDLGTESGGDIVIEERPEHELVAMNGMRIAAPGIGTWNPAFDVTPGRLVTGGIITENGIVMPEEVAKLKL